MRFLYRRADNFLAFLMVVMFATFILQITMRYLAKYQLATPFVWTQDLTSTMLLWVVLFGGGVALAEADHVKFDTVYNMFGVATRRIMAIIASLAIVGFFLYSLPAVWEYLSVLKRFNKPNPTLKFPFTYDTPVLSVHIYAMYLVFAGAVILRYAVRAVRLMLGATPDQLDRSTISAEGGHQ